MPARVFQFTEHTEEDIYLTGVYAIVNLVNNKFYIGSAVRVHKDKSACGFYARWNTHLSTLLGNSHCNQHLQRAWNKYGSENFEFRILEITEPELGEEIEQIYLDVSDDSQRYNLNPNASSCLGAKRSKEFCENLSKIHKGKTISEEHRKRLSEYFKNRFVKPFQLVSPEGQIVKGENLLQFSKDNNLSAPNLIGVIKGDKLHSSGWTSSVSNHEKFLTIYSFRGIQRITRTSGCFWSVRWFEKKQKNRKSI